MSSNVFSLSGTRVFLMERLYYFSDTDINIIFRYGKQALGVIKSA